MNKEVVPFFFLLFVLSAYFQIPVVGIAIIGLITIFVKINFTTSKISYVAFAEGSEDIDDDF